MTPQQIADEPDGTDQPYWEPDEWPGRFARPDGTDQPYWEPDDLGYGNPNTFICTDYGCSGCGARNCPTS